MDQNAEPKAGAQSRREFIRKSSIATAAVAASNGLFKTPVYGQSQAPNAGRAIGANDRIVVGFIGVGGQGFNAHVRQMKDHAKESNVAQAAVCDVSKYRVEHAKSFLGDGCEGYQDYRKLLERKDIDAIVCSTVDHWHTRVTIDALNAGKHVYVEKPMTRYLGEAFEIYDACKRTGKILQVGSQGCSDMKWHKAAEWIKAGKIGPVVMSQGSYMRNEPQGEWNYTIEDWLKPEDLDWQAWLGSQIANRPDFNPDHYFRWRKYYPYCAGLLGDLFPHKLHPYMLATGNPEFPTRVACVGNRKVETDKNASGKKSTKFIRDVPEIVQLVAEFPSGMVMHITSSSVNETGTQEMIRGHQATLTMAGNRVELRPERPFADEIDPESSESFQGETVPAHHKDWFKAIRANKQPNAGIDLATKVQTVISLAEMSERLNVMCLFDEKTRKVTTGDGRPIDPITYGTLKLS
jgi:predicted dehydrogenase